MCLCVCCVGYRIRTARPPPQFPPALPHSRAAEGRPGLGVSLLQRAAQLVGTRPPLHCCPLSRRALPVRCPLSPLASQTHTEACTLTHPPSPPGSRCRPGIGCRPSHVAPLPARGQSGVSGRRGFQGSPRAGRAVGRGALGTGAGRAGTQSHRHQEGHTHAEGGKTAPSSEGRRKRPSFAETQGALRLQELGLTLRHTWKRPFLPCPQLCVSPACRTAVAAKPGPQVGRLRSRAVFTLAWARNPLPANQSRQAPQLVRVSTAAQGWGRTGLKRAPYDVVPGWGAGRRPGPGLVKGKKDISSEKWGGGVCGGVGSSSEALGSGGCRLGHTREALSFLCLLWVWPLF